MQAGPKGCKRLAQSTVVVCMRTFTRDTAAMHLQSTLDKSTGHTRHVVLTPAADST